MDPAARTQLLRAAGQFLGGKLGDFPDSNTSNEARYQTLYKQVTKSLHLSQDKLDWFYDNPTVTKFYSEEEISRFRTRWS